MEISHFMIPPVPPRCIPTIHHKWLFGFCGAKCNETTTEMRMSIEIMRNSWYFYLSVRFIHLTSLYIKMKWHTITRKHHTIPVKLWWAQRFGWGLKEEKEQKKIVQSVGNSVTNTFWLMRHFFFFALLCICWRSFSFLSK